MLPIVFTLLPAIVGPAIMIGLNGTDQKGALLFGTYIVGSLGAVLPVIYAWVASNISGYTKKVELDHLAYVFGYLIDLLNAGHGNRHDVNLIRARKYHWYGQI
jgi:hypothetical protein